MHTAACADLIDVLFVQDLLRCLVLGVPRRPAQHADVVRINDHKAPLWVRAAEQETEFEQTAQTARSIITIPLSCSLGFGLSTLLW